MRAFESLSILTLVLAIAFIAFVALHRWYRAVIPGVTYAVAIGLVSLMYRQQPKATSPAASAVRESVAATSRAYAPPTTSGEAAVATAFRIVAAAGKPCLLGRGTGQVISVSPDGQVSPGLCPAAEATLRLASGRWRLICEGVVLSYLRPHAGVSPGSKGGVAKSLLQPKAGRLRPQRRFSARSGAGH